MEELKIFDLYEKFNIPKDKKIFMYVGNLKPHKNLERLLEAYSKIKNKEATCLVLVGKAFPKYNVLEDKADIYTINGKEIPYYKLDKNNLLTTYKMSPMAEGLFLKDNN